MDGYEECFADDESDNNIVTTRNVRYSNHENSDGEQLSGDSARDFYSDPIKENECVFDTEWAMKRKCSLSSLIYSRFLVRWEDKMKSFRWVRGGS